MRRTVILGLLAILVAYLALVWQRSSPAWFGYYHDDSLYWTAAKSLSQGEGYRMASVPGEPAQTKYPVLFPWLLSWVWHFEPSFPANLGPALGLVALAGAAFLVGSFALLRQLGLGDGTALALTAVCALHPVVVHLSGLLLSDVPFMALTVWSLVLAGLALQRDGTRQGARFWAAALALAVLACLLRTIGVTLLGGIALSVLWRRRYRPAAACVALAALLVVGALWPTAATTGEVWAADSVPTGPSTVTAGYAQTMQFYSSYLAFWKLSVPDTATFWALVTFNFREMLKQPAIAVFNLPASGFAGFGWQLAAVALSFAIVKGMVGLARQSRHSAFAVLGFYAAVVLVWNYTLMDRFFAWALPLLLAGAWFEISRLARTTRELFRPGAAGGERAVAAVMMALFAAAGLYGGYRYLWVTPRALAASLAERRALGAEKLQAYDWIRGHAAPSDRFIASEDASLYLYTGRQALRPMAFSTAAFYLQSRPILRQDLARLADTPRQIGARYWLAAADDYHLESAEEFIQKRSGELLAATPEVFRSPAGGVRIYDLGPDAAALATGSLEARRLEDGAAAANRSSNPGAAGDPAAGDPGRRN